MYRGKQFDGQTYVSQREASRRIGVCQATMAKMILRGSISVKRIPGVRSVWVKEADLEDYVGACNGESEVQADR